ncbi:MAG: glucokinase [Alphaproteobacteria bacterium]|nr:glucokinase [Alphaproteobacteria bacterium]
MTRLVADIGGTNVRFGIVDKNGVEAVRAMLCNDFPTLADAARAYLDETGAKPDTGAFAIAAPLDGSDHVEMPNHAWAFSITETEQKIGLKNLRVINDFAALAYGAPFLSENDLRKIGSGTVRKGHPIGIIGPGTGLGVGAVVFTPEGKPVPVTTEGGHVTMPATTQREYDVFEHLRNTKYSHVSAERVCSGKGMVNLYNAICAIDGLDLPERAPSEITAAALEKSCPVCVEVLDLFCHFLGVVAGNLALNYGAFGGVYIGGGIVTQLGDYFAGSRFRESFEAKGRFREYLSHIPSFVITHPYPGLEGLRQVA